MQAPYHPLFIHFPIAFYFLGVLLTLGYLWRKDADYERFAYWSFFLSWLAAIVASFVGLVDQGQLAYDDPRQDVLNQHISLAILFIIFDGLLVYSRFRWQDILNSPKQWWYLGLILLGMIVIAATGWFGGELVYELGVGQR